MGKKTILFLHGFTSSAKSEKANYLREQCKTLPGVEFFIFDFNPTPKDFEFLTITGMINRVRQFLLDHPKDDVRLIASSLGGFIALQYAEWFGGITKMLLLAPVLFYHPWGTSKEEIALWKQQRVADVAHQGFQQELPLRYTFHEDGLRYTSPILPATQTTIIHGNKDQTIPIQHSRDYAAAHPDMVHLVETESDHRLTGRHNLIWEQTQSFLLT
ncbi:MAG: YqiA/YcfP family alpha/beta fold hydrolase [Desulfoplanes sp.]|nr:hypothetical protein [Desulfoplanes sp.]